MVRHTFSFRCSRFRPMRLHERVIARYENQSAFTFLSSTFSTFAHFPSDFRNGAATRSRTLDLLITSELLYQLSYGGQNGGGILKNEIRQRNRHEPVYLCFPEFRWSQRHFAAGDSTNLAVLLKK